MKKIVLSLFCLGVFTSLVFAQDQKNTSFYSGTKIDLKKGISVNNMHENFILTGISLDNPAATVEVFLKRGTDAVTIKEYKVLNSTLVFKFDDLINENQKFKSGDAGCKDQSKGDLLYTN